MLALRNILEANLARMKHAPYICVTQTEKKIADGLQQTPGCSAGDRAMSSGSVLGYIGEA